jgi:hypothetical protein
MTKPKLTQLSGYPTQSGWNLHKHPETNYFFNNFSHLVTTARNAFSLECASFAS